MPRDLSAPDAMEALKPVCRELSHLLDEGLLSFVSAKENGDGSFAINLKASKFHFASRGFKDSIGDIEYGSGSLKIGLRSSGRPGIVYVELL
ncbi:MAG: hypothetical protein ABI361_04760 [Nitrososphaera sp.]|jgi:hypothetical protein